MHAKPTLLLAAGLLLSIVTLPVHADDKPLSSAKLKSLTKRFREAIHANDPKKRRKAWSKAKKDAKRLTAEQLETVIAEAGRAEQMRPGFQHDIEFVSGKTKFRYSVHCPPKPKSRLLPLVVDPGHASLADADSAGVEGVMSTWLNVSGSREDVILVRTRVLDQLTAEKKYTAMAKPKVSGTEHSDRIARALMDAIAHASKHFPVDPDRIYVQGISQTGYWAWQLGAFAPGRFAAICPVGAVAWHVRERYPSFRNLKVFILHGEDDTVCPFEQAKQAAEKLKQLQFPVDFRPIAGGEHIKNTFPRWRSMWPDVAKVTRNPWPRHVTGNVLTGEATDLYWIELGGVTAKGFDLFRPVANVEAKVDEQTITIQATGAKELRLCLSPKLLDVTKDVTVVVNGKKAFKGVPKVDAEIALQRAVRTSDFTATGSAFVTVKVR